MENTSIILHFVEVWIWYTLVFHWVLGIKCIRTQIILTLLGAYIIVSRLLECSLIQILCLWFRASLIYNTNCPTRCNTKQSIYYSASSLYMFRVSTTSIIRITQNCNYSLLYWSYIFVQLSPSNVAKLSWPCRREVAAQKYMTSTGGSSYSFVYSSWWVTCSMKSAGNVFIVNNRCNYSRKKPTNKVNL